MKFKKVSPNNFLLLTSLILASVIFITFPPLSTTPLRIILGFPLILFLPGYSLICALFPKKDELNIIEKIALSIGLSIAVVVIIGLVLNYSLWGIRLGPILLAISSFTLISGGIGELREKGIKNYKNISIDKTTLIIFSLIIIYGFLSHLYFPLRYSGLIADGDMAKITKTIQAMQSQRTIFTTYRYGSGFGLQLIITFLSDITALSIQKLLILPTGFLYLIIAYPLFLKFIKNKKTALLATFLLSLQPDLLFATSRGSHERFTSVLILTSIFILIQLIFTKHDRKKFIVYLTLFYITTFSLTSFNIWFSAFLAFGILFTALISFFLSKLFNVDDIPSQKMFYITIPLIILLYLTPYIYPPLGSMWRHINIWRGKLPPFSLSLLAIAAVAIFSLFLFIKTFSKNILNFLKINLVGKFRHKILYGIIGFGLFIFLVYILAVSSNLLSFPPFIWMFLTLFNWIIFPLSVIMALRIIWNFIQKKKLFSLSHLFLLSFYASFTLPLLITIFLDRVIGTGIGDNLELRVFRYFMFFPVALASIEILKWMHRSHTKKWQITGKITFIILIFILSINSLLKSTCDPLVSNKWIFYSVGEKMAMKFIESNLKETDIWAGFDGRIRNAFNYQSNFDSRKIKFTANPTTAKYYFISTIIRERASKDEYSLPLLKSLSRVYDNNKTRLYEQFSE